MDPLSALAVGGLVESISGKVLDLAAGQATPKVRAWLKREPAQLAFKAALLQAVNRFAADHPAWAAALMDEAFFTAEDTARELERFLTRRGAPDPGRLAKAWAGRLPGVAPDRRAEAAQALADFLRLFEDELGKQEALRPLFDSRALEKITTNTEALLDLLETTLLSLQSAWEKAYAVFTGGEIAVAGNVWGSVLISGHHNVVYQTIRTHDSTLQDAVYDFSSAIDELSRHFIGREFLLAEVEAFMDAHDRGIFRLVADAGLGKSAVAAVWARYFQAPVFFFGTRGSVSPARCLEHLCAELIGRYELDHDHLPTRAGEDANFLATVLREAHEKSGRPVVLVLDALDEAEGTTAGPWLSLPDPLPEGAYILVTHRPGDYPLPPSPERVFTLAWDDPRQQADIERYLRLQAHRLSNLLQAASVSPEEFVTALKQRSEGNFMYLTYVLGDIERREPGFHPLRPEGLPRGLQGYYDAFWRRMEESKNWEGYETWRGLYKPTLALLAVAAEPVPVDWLADHTGRDAEEIRERVLQPWRRFLRQERYGGKGFWSIVHQSFGDFLAGKFPLEKYHRRVADFYLGNPARWQVHEGYALRYLSHHLLQAGMFNELAALVESPSWYAAHEDREYDSIRRPFAEDVKRALEIAEARVKEKGQVDALSLVIAWSLLYATERTLVTRVPLEALEAMVLLGQTERALDYAALITEPKRQYEAYWRIGLRLYEQGEKEKAKQALYRALENTQKISDARQRADVLIAMARGAFPQIGDKALTQEALQRAAEAVKKIGNVHENVHTLSPPGRDFYQQTNKWQRDWGISRSIDYAHGLSTKALALAQKGNNAQAREALRRALEAARKIGNVRERSYALGALAQALGQAGHWHCALEAIHKIDDARTQARILIFASQALPQIGDKDQAQEVFQYIVETAQKHGDVRRISYALSALAQALALAGNKAQAQEVFQRAVEAALKIGNDLRRVDALNVLAHALAQAGDKVQAQKILNRSLVAIQENDNVLWRAPALTTVAQIFAQVGEETRAREALRLALEAARKIDKADLPFLNLTAVAQTLAQIDDREGLHRALKIAQETGDVAWRANALTAVAQALAQVGEEEQAREALRLALEAARKIDKSDLRLRYFSAVAQTLAQIGDREGLHRALKIAQETGDVAWRANALTAVAQALAQVGEEEQAREALHHSLATIQKIDKPSRRAKTFATVAQTLAQLGDEEYAGKVLHRALETTQKIDNVGGFAISLTAVAQALVQVGKEKQAKEVLYHALEVIQKPTTQNFQDAMESANALSAVTQALAQLTTPTDAEAAGWTANAFRLARVRGREEVWEYIRAFAPLLARLGVIGETWQHIQAVEAVVNLKGG